MCASGSFCDKHLHAISSESITMTAIGSLVFCTDCGNLLDETEGEKNVLLRCDVCGAVCKGASLTKVTRLGSHMLTIADKSSKVIVTQSKPSAFPSSLRAKRSEVQQISESDAPAQATTRETCDKCGRKEVNFYEQQTRGADEGTTIYYTCECGNKYVGFKRLDSYSNILLQMDSKQLRFYTKFLHIFMSLFEALNAVNAHHSMDLTVFRNTSARNLHSVCGFRHKCVLKRPGLFELGHVERNNYALPHNLLRII